MTRRMMPHRDTADEMLQAVHDSRAAATWLAHQRRRQGCGMRSASGPRLKW
jgi:hypothetical protein